MCLAIPVQITAIYEDDRARVNLGGIEKDISTALLDDIAIGDYVILHVGYALTRMDEEEAQKTLRIFKEMLEQDVSPTGCQEHIDGMT